MTEVDHPVDLRLAEKMSDKKFRMRFFIAESSALIAEQIIALRKRRGYNQKEVAEKVGTKQPAISRVEQADYRNWSFNTLRSIAEVLDARIRVSIEASEDIIHEYQRPDAHLAASQGTAKTQTAQSDSPPNRQEIGQSAKVHEWAEWPNLLLLDQATSAAVNLTSVNALPNAAMTVSRSLPPMFGSNGTLTIPPLSVYGTPSSMIAGSGAASIVTAAPNTVTGSFTATTPIAVTGNMVTAGSGVFFGSTPPVVKPVLTGEWFQFSPASNNVPNANKGDIEALSQKNTRLEEENSSYKYRINQLETALLSAQMAGNKNTISQYTQKQGTIPTFYPDQSSSRAGIYQ